MNKIKSIIIIDGSNFYFKLKELNLNNISSFDYSKFAIKIAENTFVKMKYYCVGKIRAKQRNSKARKMMAKQQAFVTKLQKHGFIIQFGYLLKSDKNYHEKGVDVQIATNILKGAFSDQYDRAYLISSDSDLIPAIKEAQLIKKEIIYIGFQRKPSFALLRICKKSFLLTKNDLLPFIKKL